MHILYVVYAIELKTLYKLLIYLYAYICKPILLPVVSLGTNNQLQLIKLTVKMLEVN